MEGNKKSKINENIVCNEYEKGREKRERERKKREVLDQQEVRP